MVSLHLACVRELWSCQGALSSPVMSCVFTTGFRIDEQKDDSESELCQLRVCSNLPTLKVNAADCVHEKALEQVSFLKVDQRRKSARKQAA